MANDTELDNVRVRFFYYQTLADTDSYLDVLITHVIYFIIYRVIPVQHRLTQSFMFETGKIRYVY